VRLLDLPGALAQTSLDTDLLRFNVALSDPIESFLEDTPWRGTAGDYVVEIGPTCRAAPGWDPTLPTLTASVNAFSRLWLGVRPASTLSWTDELSGPPDLLTRLDRALRLPPPSPDWEF